MSARRLLTAAALLLLIPFTGCGQGSPEPILSSLNVSTAISSARELTTLKYEYTDFGSYEREADTVKVPILPFNLTT